MKLSYLLLSLTYRYEFDLHSYLDAINLPFFIDREAGR